jgi:glycine cleavage system H protein
MALEYPPDLRYVDTHEYIRVEDDIAVIGITAYAVDQLGDIVFVGLPEEGDRN